MAYIACKSDGLGLNHASIFSDLTGTMQRSWPVAWTSLRSSFAAAPDRDILAEARVDDETPVLGALSTSRLCGFLPALRRFNRGGAILFHAPVGYARETSLLG